jgi:hypothetical protein|tara:strand:- start:20 stop:262 length:243 start_codon:yes stop_codon:yes gene_type:complete
MEFQPGDLVTYKDQFTQNGNFDGANAIMVLKTMISRPACQRPADRFHRSNPERQQIFVHNLKTGVQGWDFANGYVKMLTT